ncbi:bacterial regulatory s, tetR family protein [Paraburkholderia xenovorans LB400]|uniref:Transcriptional regulator, TetR family n=2 Tax=Paraburkholderia xenovorans TaxID=36873 RepID=Q143M6_PARXL|nr:transcriptional regulator, TetR family [Paraburkholderia xenovorans LB400]AIP31025.1 bacterial regulatory s, tetR family protein [Paraburkholderia xenovorans LB400]
MFLMAVSRVKGPGTTGGGRRTQAERTEETRGRLLDASVQVLAKKGYVGFRTADVAELAQVSRGALTHHFPSKDKLIIATLEYAFSGTAERGAIRAHRPRSVDETIAALIKDSQDFFFSDLFLIGLEFAALNLREPDGPIQIHSISRSSRLPVESVWVEALIDSGIPKAIAEDVLWLTNSIIRGLAVRRLWQHDRARFNRTLRAWQSIIKSYIEQYNATSANRK